jgi:hypothetical protein
MNKAPQKPPNATILDYLRKIPLYPFDPKIDPDFVDELLADFGTAVDVLEETKAFRWYHADQGTSGLRSARLSLRRWLTNAKTPRRR